MYLADQSNTPFLSYLTSINSANKTWRESLSAREASRNCHMINYECWKEHTKACYQWETTQIIESEGNHPKKWDKTGIIIKFTNSTNTENQCIRQSNHQEQQTPMKVHPSTMKRQDDQFWMISSTLYHYNSAVSKSTFQPASPPQSHNTKDQPQLFRWNSTSSVNTTIIPPIDCAQNSTNSHLKQELQKSSTTMSPSHHHPLSPTPVKPCHSTWIRKPPEWQLSGSYVMKF